MLVSGLSTAQVALIGKVTILAFVLALLASLGWWREAGVIVPPGWRWILPFLPVIMLGLLQASGLSQGSKLADSIVVAAVIALLIGFTEEVLFRGILVRAILGPVETGEGALRAAVLASAIFGLVHVGALLVGQDPIYTAVQCLAAALLGFAFTAPFLYTGTIWPLVLVHALMDFTVFVTSGAFVGTTQPTIADIAPSLVLFGLLTAYGYWLLRRLERRARATAALPQAA